MKGHGMEINSFKKEYEFKVGNDGERNLTVDAVSLESPVIKWMMMMVYYNVTGNVERDAGCVYVIKKSAI